MNEHDIKEQLFEKTTKRYKDNAGDINIVLDNKKYCLALIPTDSELYNICKQDEAVKVVKASKCYACMKPDRYGINACWNCD